MYCLWCIWIRTYELWLKIRHVIVVVVVIVVVAVAIAAVAYYLQIYLSNYLFWHVHISYAYAYFPVIEMKWNETNNISLDVYVHQLSITLSIYQSTNSSILYHKQFYVLFFCSCSCFFFNFFNFILKKCMRIAHMPIFQSFSSIFDLYNWIVIFTWIWGCPYSSLYKTIELHLKILKNKH